MAGIVFSLGGTDTHQIAKSISDEIENYSTNLVYMSEQIELYDVSYPSYPTERFDLERFTIILEGEIYAPGDYRSSLKKLFSDSIPSDEKFQAWAKDIDGDYNLYVIDESQSKIHIFTDILNRLPVYWATLDNTSFGGRSLQFMRRSFQKRSEILSLDQMSIAEFLLLGYYIGKKTPYNQVNKSVPASKLSLSISKSKHSVYNQLTFDEKHKNDRSVRENAKILSDLLKKVVENRSNLDGSHVVSLSGGKDSRLIAAVLADLEMNIRGYSFYNNTSSANKDVSIALQIAQELEIDWTLFSVRNSGSSLVSLYRTKGGMNYLAMGFQVEFLRKIMSDNNKKVRFYTGDIGDLLDGSWSFNDEFISDRDAVKWLISNYSYNSPDIIEKITGVTKKELISELVSCISSLPEENEEDRLQHFLTQERGFNMDFHGEDRNRSYVWTLAPLNSWPVIDHLMSIPKNQKFRYKLTKEVFNIINKDMIRIDYAPYNAPMGTYRQLFREKNFGITSRFNKLKNKIPISSEKTSYENDPVVEYTNYLQSKNIDENIALDQMERVLNMGSSEKYTILTVLAIIEDLEDDIQFLKENQQISY
ncbi:asparagine synthase-related protein [Halorubrum sp. LN27]|uniref:asparagine synthase-related protein n=1 Tax=Halorubrum sp. LN27 TaxID=2801032 RepID=UPI00190A302E|nr:asparagine synthase-related protein [Halorubrum sp. LN27]